VLATGMDGWMDGGMTEGGLWWLGGGGGGCEDVMVVA